MSSIERDRETHHSVWNVSVGQVFRKPESRTRKGSRTAALLRYGIVKAALTEGRHANARDARSVRHLIAFPDQNSPKLPVQAYHRCHQAIDDDERHIAPPRSCTERLAAVLSSSRADDEKRTFCSVSSDRLPV